MTASEFLARERSFTPIPDSTHNTPRIQPIVADFFPLIASLLFNANALTGPNEQNNLVCHIYRDDGDRPRN
jgi:hypothetical protein